MVNSMTPVRCRINLEIKLLKLFMQTISLSTRWEIALIWMPANLTKEKLALIQVMAWCRQAASQ